MTNLLTFQSGEVGWHPAVFVYLLLAVIVLSAILGASLIVLWHAFKVCLVWWLRQRNDTLFYQPPLIEREAMAQGEAWRDGRPVPSITVGAKIDAVTDVIV